MNLEEKIKRLVELKKIQYPSDQEVEEKERLQEELGLEAHESRVEHSKHFSGTPITEPKEPDEPKPSMLKKILRIKPKVPVTKEELEQLELEAKKCELKARIAKAKAEGPSIFDTITKVIGKSNNNPFDVSASTKQKRSDYDPFRW